MSDKKIKESEKWKYEKVDFKQNKSEQKIKNWETMLKNEIRTQRDAEWKEAIDKRIKKVSKDFDRYKKQSKKGEDKQSREYGEFMTFRMLSVWDELKELKSAMEAK